MWCTCRCNVQPHPGMSALTRRHRQVTLTFTWSAWCILFHGQLIAWWPWAQCVGLVLRDHCSCGGAFEWDLWLPPPWDNLLCSHQCQASSVGDSSTPRHWCCRDHFSSAFCSVKCFLHLQCVWNQLGRLSKESLQNWRQCRSHCASGRFWGSKHPLPSVPASQAIWAMWQSSTDKRGWRVALRGCVCLNELLDFLWILAHQRAFWMIAALRRFCGTTLAQGLVDGCVQDYGSHLCILFP